MADNTLAAAPILGGIDMAVGRGRIVERDDLALVSLAVPQGGDAALAGALKRAFGLAVPEPARSTQKDGMRVLRTSPDQMLLVFAHPTPDASAKVRADLQGTAYTTDQTDAWVVLALSGEDALPALERLCLLDLAPGCFPVGACARTVMEHIGAMILRTGADSFLLFSASSSARSFLDALETSLHNVHA